MDLLNRKILLELTRNSRTPITSLAKKVGASREVVNYRIFHLLEEKIILGFITDIDTGRMGFLSAALFINIRAKREKEFEEFIKKCNFTSWSSEFSGVWRFGVDIYGRTNEEIHERFQKIYSLFKEDIIDHRLNIYKQKYFFYEKYFNVIDKSLKDSTKNNSYILDKTDKIILKGLAKKARLDCVELSEKVNLSAPAVITRIKNLVLNGFIKDYFTFLDISKLNLFEYSIFITNKDIDDKNKLISYLSKHPKVSFIAEYIGDPFVEFGLFVQDPYNLRKELQEIEESFPNNRITEVFLIQKEFLSIGAPDMVFD